MGVYVLQARDSYGRILERFEIKDCYPTAGRYGIWNWEFFSDGSHGLRETSDTFYTKWCVSGVIQIIWKFMETNRPTEWEEYQYKQTLEVLEWVERIKGLYEESFFTLMYSRK